MLASPAVPRRDWEEESGSLISRSALAAMENEAAHLRVFTKIYTATQILGVLCVVLTGIWIAVFRGGLGWTNAPLLQFNWHPLMMIIGMVFFYANGALIYRGFRTERKKKLKFIHAIILFIAYIMSIVGTVAVFAFHNKKGIANLYSLHSWIGLSLILLFSLQWICGLVTFLLPGLRSSIRTAYLPVHQYFGLAMFVAAVANSLLGFTEKAIFAKDALYSKKSPEGILINFIGLTLVLFCGSVVYMVANRQFTRRIPEDELLLNDTVME